MRKIIIRIMSLAVVVTGVVFLLSCNGKAADQTDTTGVAVKPVATGPAVDTDMSVWVTYWDLEDSMDEIDARQDGIKGISYFAAYFDENEDIFIPEEITAFYHDANRDFAANNWDNYLTVVNDKILSEGTSLKDTALLKRLFKDEASMKAHIDRLVKVAKDGGYDGIDIDYEAIKSDMALWKQFATFCGKLYERTEKEGLKLRVLFEPGAPLEELKFPKGPEYVMMCYNLYGGGKDTGPKADNAFINKMINKMSVLPGKKSFALATGGYDWESGSTGRQLSEKDAVAISEKAKAKLRRDKKSGALTFAYKDDEGAKHTVWFADKQTVEQWQDIILKSGDYGIMLWRVGGNIVDAG